MSQTIVEIAAIQLAQLSTSIDRAAKVNLPQSPSAVMQQIESALRRISDMADPSSPRNSDDLGASTAPS